MIFEVDVTSVTFAVQTGPAAFAYVLARIDEWV
jgi:hypothetical protein